jgi:hypothetical protein
MDTIERIDCLDRIVGHEPKSAMQHTQVKRYIVKYIGFPQEFDLDPVLFYNKIPLFVEAYWKIM